MEIWKEINGYKPIYFVSSYGRIKSICRETRCNRNGKYIRKERLLRFSHTRRYLTAYLYDENGKKKSVLVHRIVANAFIDNPNKLKEIDHIDGNPENNRVENLRWVTHKQNCNNPTTLLKTKGKPSKHRKAVAAYNLDGTLYKIFPSVQLAAEETGAHRANIRKCINGKYKTCASLIFKYC